jgi:hypothetical protein
VVKVKNPTQMPHGYWKDLLNTLALATLDQLDDRNPRFLHAPRGFPNLRRSFGPSKMTAAERHTATTTEAIEVLVAAKTQKAQALARNRHARNAAGAHKFLLSKLSEPQFRTLYVAVTRLFAGKLVEQAALMREA